MCIIAIKPKGQKMWDDETIRTMFRNNPDGAGYMYFDGKDVVIHKGFMDVDTLLVCLKNKDYTNTNLVLHFRIGTSGKNNEFNCHPFPVYDKNILNTKTDIAMAHNGILHQFEPPRDSKINDTQVFIRNVLRPLNRGFQNDDNVTYLIGRIVGTNKLAFLDNNNMLTLIGDFITDKGYIYSNDSYKPRQYKHYWEDYPWTQMDKKFSLR